MQVRRRRVNWFAVLGAFVAVFLFTFLVQRFADDDEVDAANLGAFDAGYIISDYQMGNYTSMSEAEIQSFLKSKNGCNDRDLSKTGNNVGHLSESTPYSWHVKDGHYVCMADENFNGESAAHIIWQAARDYKINPQVLIVLLQKEQGLVTDTFPNSVQYRSATGYGCPDTAACSSKYYGFRNQVRNAAAMFRSVLDGGWTNYPLGNNYVKYNPNAACGGSIVNIRNLATSALYRYTPYQPNAAVLAGGSDGCSAYGNKNFYQYFEDWFGGITWGGWPTMDTLLSSNRAAVEESELEFKYRTHIEHYGWLNWVDGGEMAGTSGFSLQVEALQMKLDDSIDGGISYRAHVADVGWMNWMKNGELAGTTGKSKQVEAVQIKLTGEVARRYSIYYRAHVADIGWMDWVSDGDIAGTVGKAKQVEAIQVKIVKKENELDLNYQAHVADIGWMDWANSGEIAGTVGKAKQIEAVRVELPEGVSEDEIEYRAHVATIGWMDWVNGGEIAGTTGRAKQVEAVQIKLSDALMEQYDIYYRAHVADIGWMDWVKDGEIAGTTGRAKRLEAVQIELIEKE